MNVSTHPSSSLSDFCIPFSFILCPLYRFLFMCKYIIYITFLSLLDLSSLAPYIIILILLYPAILLLLLSLSLSLSLSPPPPPPPPTFSNPFHLASHCHPSTPISQTYPSHIFSFTPTTCSLPSHVVPFFFSDTILPSIPVPLWWWMDWYNSISCTYSDASLASIHSWQPTLPVCMFSLPLCYIFVPNYEPIRLIWLYYFSQLEQNRQTVFYICRKWSIPSLLLFTCVCTFNPSLLHGLEQRPINKKALYVEEYRLRLQLTLGCSAEDDYWGRTRGLSVGSGVSMVVNGVLCVLCSEYIIHHVTKFAL